RRHAADAPLSPFQNRVERSGENGSVVSGRVAFLRDRETRPRAPRRRRRRTHGVALSRHAGARCRRPRRRRGVCAEARAVAGDDHEAGHPRGDAAAGVDGGPVEGAHRSRRARRPPTSDYTCHAGRRNMVARRSGRRNGGSMSLTGLIWFLLIGLIAGWLAGKVMRGGGYGVVGDMIVGVIGALIGGWLFGQLGIAAGGLLGAIIT